MASRIARRMTKWLRRRKLLEERPVEERSNEASELSPLEACMQMSLFGGTFHRMRTAANDIEVADEDVRRRGAKSPWIAEEDGFNVHAGAIVRAGDRDGLERLCRYGARPPFSLERLSLLPDGRVAYLLRKRRRSGATHLVMTPVQCLARISALVPPPRFPLVRFAGVLAPGSAWRHAVVGMRPPLAHAAFAPARKPNAKKKRKKKKRKKKKNEAETPSGGTSSAALVAPRSQAAPRRGLRSVAEETSPSGPRTRLAAGLVPPCYARIDWASLLRRTYLDDVLACPCGGRRSVLADIHERHTIVAILAHLGLDPDPPPIARARDPTGDAP